MGALSRLLLRLFGWQLQGNAPTAPRFVFIASPHTSNWDFIWMLLAASALGFKISWLGKHTLFKAPFGGVMRWLGGVPIKRDSGGDYVTQIAAQFAAASTLALAVPVEGTRGRSEHWRSGFFYIAQAAQVPVVFSYLDYGRRLVGIGPTLAPGLTLVETMNRARAFYDPMRGKYPHLSGPARLKEEALDE
ncbi:MAG: 1-acyl-sn-glycerol-3-phosphate acyltransferase [Pseudomonadales bacterium]